MTEQQYWDYAMNQVRISNRVLLHKSKGEAFIPVYDESEAAFTFAVLDNGSGKKLAVF